ncbi:MAG: thermonuclease family protein [Elusimicrobiaceae bacterium]|nr:thermonuclease family protein [Elusimicrobiaceae bacterium]
MFGLLSQAQIWQPFFMYKYFLIILFLVFTGCINNKNFKKAELLSVYDGDTFKVNFTCKEPLVCKNISIRIKGIDTPEINSKNKCEKLKGIQAKTFTENFLNKKGEIVLKNCGRDKYFRLGCEVFVNKENLAFELLKAGLALSYDGKAKIKKDWCK